MERDPTTLRFYGALAGLFLGALLGYLLFWVVGAERWVAFVLVTGLVGAVLGGLQPRLFVPVGRALAWPMAFLMQLCNP
jgi:hypothetical protein